MPVEACSISRMKAYKFRLEINGLPAALIQEFDPGDRTHGVSVHAGAGQNYVCKEVGMISYGNCTLHMVVPLDGPGRVFLNDWMDLCQDPATGNGEVPSKYMKDFSLYELDPTGSPSRVWEFKRGFPVKHSIAHRSAFADGTDLIETLEITYAKREMRIVG